MNEQLAIYLWSISEGVKNFCSFIGPVGAILLGMCSFGMFSEENKKVGIAFLVGCVVCIMMAITSVFIPNKQDLALIMLYPHIKSGTEQALQSSTAKKMKEVVDLYLDDTIKRLK